MHEPSVYEYQSARTYLNALYEFRRTRNRRYSQRALAAALGVSSAMLSYLQKGARHLSKPTARQLAGRLGLPAQEEEYFLLLAEYDATQDPSEKRRLLTRLRTFRPRNRPLTLKTPTSARPPHASAFSILEACALGPVGEAEIHEIARQLKMSADDVEKALAMHLANGLVEKDAQGKYCRVQGEVKIEPFAKKTKIDDFHRETIDLARSALKTAALEERVFASVFLPIRKDRLGEFRAKIYGLLDEFHDATNDETAPDSVYGLTVGLFPTLTQGNSQ